MLTQTITRQSIATVRTSASPVSGSLARKQSARVVLTRADKNDRKLDFAPSSRSGLGFTDDDSAGQSNIFAVEPKQYVSDSNTSSNVGGPAIAGAVAVGLIVAGIRILSQGEADEVVPGPDAGLQSLGAYAEMFTVKETPAVVVETVVVEAPALSD